MKVKKLYLAFLLIIALVTTSGCCCTGITSLFEKEKNVENEIVSSDNSDTKNESSAEKENSGLPQEGSTDEPSQDAFDESSAASSNESSQPDVSQSGLITPDRNMRQRFNIFLSNFSEQMFAENYIWSETESDYILDSEEFLSATGDIDTMVSFAHLYAKINLNKQKTVLHGGYAYDGISLNTINILTERFFNRTVTANDIPTGEFLEHAGYKMIVIDNMVCTPAADGGTFNKISICKNVYELGDGRYKVEFDIFSIENEDIAPTSGTIKDKSVYYFTSQQASARTDFYHRLNGIAVIEPYVDDEGKDRIYLHSYQVFDN